jgi:hypothetical protein
MMEQSDTNVARVFELCRDIEIAFARMYDYFAELFCDSSIMSHLWRKTALEELDHANRFATAMRLAKQDGAEQVTFDLESLRQILNVVASIDSQIRENPPSLSDALSCAVMLENMLAEKHTASVTYFVEDDHKRIFADLCIAGKGHVTTLTSANKLMPRHHPRESGIVTGFQC